MKIVEQQEQRSGGGLRGDPLLECTAQLVPHQDAIAARGAELHALLAGKPRPDHLAEELHHAPGIGQRQSRTNTLAQFRLPELGRILRCDSGRLLHEVGDQAERRP